MSKAIAGKEKPGSCWISHMSGIFPVPCWASLPGWPGMSKSARRQLKITGLGPVLRDTFRIGHFEPLFAIYDDKASALQAFR